MIRRLDKDVINSNWYSEISLTDIRGNLVYGWYTKVKLKLT